MPHSESSVHQKQEEVYRIAHALFSKNPKPSWVTFFKEILGLHGMVRQTYPTPGSLATFERTETYTKLLEMLTKLREIPLPEDAKAGEEPENDPEPVRVITVRVPESVHESIRIEAHERHTSMNKLCISKLLRAIEKDLIPAEAWRRPIPKREQKKVAGEDL